MRPLDSDNDDWSGNPQIDRMRLLQRAHDEMHVRRAAKPHLKVVPPLPDEETRYPRLMSEEERVRIEQGDPESIWLPIAAVIFAIVAVVTLITILT